MTPPKPNFPQNEGPSLSPVSATWPNTAKPKKPRCKQQTNGDDIPAIKKKLEDAGLLPYIQGLRESQHYDGRKKDKREGVEFTITNVAAFERVLRSNPAFTRDNGWPLNKEHKDQVGRDARDYRSYTTGGPGETLGPDEFGYNDGITRSLQVDFGSIVRGANGLITGRGYADLDCANPAQDLISLFKHLFGPK